jgi:hypothetical protein
MRSAQTPFGIWAIMKKILVSKENIKQIGTCFGTVMIVPIKYEQTMNKL